jgi:hypothetical protein
MFNKILSNLTDVTFLHITWENILPRLNQLRRCTVIEMLGMGAVRSDIPLQSSRPGTSNDLNVATELTRRWSSEIQLPTKYVMLP